MAMKVVQIASSASGTPFGGGATVRTLARGYRAAGHTVVQVVPGTGDRRTQDGDAVRVTVAAPRLPGTGRRMFTRGHGLSRALDDVRPDRIDVIDPFAPQAVGRWARRHQVPTAVIAHERLDAAFAWWVGSPRRARFLADFWNLRLVTSFDTIVCSTDDGCEEFRRLGTPNLVSVPGAVGLVDTMLAIHGMPVRQAA
jgi:alpha-1,6-mannosyltransferase